jgi:NAD(P)H-hydrate epimerase
VAVLKGAGTVIHSPSAEYALCAAGNAALARAGSGDILAGIIGTLLAQMPSAYEAAQAGVWCHAAAAESLAQETGYAGLDINRLARRAARLMESPPPPTAP